MKKLFVIVLVMFVVWMSGCSVPTDEVLQSLGEYKSEQYFTSGGFQDYTNYAKYTYEDVDFSNNIYFSEISTGSSENLITHIKDFEKWVELLEEDNEVALAYDFDSSVISKEDYLYIYDDPNYSKLGCYDVYFFDVETMTLYYFHNNI